MNVTVENAESLSFSEDYTLLVKQFREALNQERTKDFVPGMSSIWLIERESTKTLFEKICSQVLGFIQENHFSRSCKLIDAKALKHFCPANPSRKEGAFIWHTDNHPPSILNVMIYLSDVDEDCGPMQYCVDSENIVFFEYSPPSGGVLKEDFFAKNSNLQVKSLVGPSGTTFIFSNRIMHRASIPIKKERDALILQVEGS